ncbi:MAG: FHA domain-containing protein [Actinomycetaceae bacterium]|nr:FHA domain-containing protein [Actinomycetaceae bacterium]
MTRSLAEEAADPSTTPQRMRELIQTDRSLYATVACNPNVDEPLRQWLWVNGGRDVQEAMVRQYEEAVRAQQEAQAEKEDAKGAQKKATEKPAEKKAQSADKARTTDSTADAKKADSEKIAAERAAAERAAAERAEAERLAAERAEAERLAQEEAARLEAARAEAERLEAERKAVQARLDAEKAESERLAAEEAARAEEQRRLAEQRKAAAELAAIQAEAQAFASQDSVAKEASASPADDDDAESTVVVNRSSRPTTRLVTAGGQSFELTNDVVILGRRPRGFLAGSVQLINVKDTERTISKTHARLSWHDDAWYISDLGSTNGVSVGFGKSKIELSGSEEVKVEGPFALGLHDMNLEIAQ